jgi:hypothetical protein
LRAVAHEIWTDIRTILNGVFGGDITESLKTTWRGYKFGVRGAKGEAVR